MVYAALDIGGTKTIAALVDETGMILAQKKFASLVSSWQEHLHMCADALLELSHAYQMDMQSICGLGITLPGIVDNENGVLLYAPYEKWENVPVAQYFRDKVGVDKICCDNDVNACAIGELRFGLGRKYTDFIWMTVSTGVGGAVVSNGALLRGSEGFAGELGHLKVEYTDPVPCPCGQKGCLEAQGSGTALNRLTAQMAESRETFARALVDAQEKADGAGCAKLARQGNQEARAIFDAVGTYLGRGISYCINICNPQAIIIGGGVAASLELLRPAIDAAIQANAFQKMQNVQVVCTPLGYEAALLGAAALVMDDVEEGAK